MVEVSTRVWSMFAGTNRCDQTNTILSHINNHRYHLVNIDLLGVLLAVLCLSFHFADASLCEQLFLDYSACSEYAQHLYAGAQVGKTFGDVVQTLIHPFRRVYNMPTLPDATPLNICKRSCKSSATGANNR